MPGWITDYRLKTSDETRNSTTLASDSVLTFTPAANTKYLFDCSFQCTAPNTTVDFKFALAVPTDSLSFTLWHGTQDANQTTLNSVVHCGFIRPTATSGTQSLMNGSATAGAFGWVHMHGMIITTTLTTAIALRYAQGAANASVVTVKAGSWMAWEIIP